MRLTLFEGSLLPSGYGHSPADMGLVHLTRNAVPATTIATGHWISCLRVWGAGLKPAARSSVDAFVEMWPLWQKVGVAAWIIGVDLLVVVVLLWIATRWR